MKTILEFTGFLAAAFAAHVIVLPDMPKTSSASQGGDGIASVVIVASNGSLAEMVAEWNKPPEVAQVAEMRPPMMLGATLPSGSSATGAPRMGVPVLHAMVTPSDALPQIDLTVAPPRPTASAPTQSPRPVARPLRRAAAPAKQPAASLRARETASGSGQNTTAGTVKTAPRVATAPAPRSSPAALSQWGGAIRSNIERRKGYPTGTRASGVVTLRITVSSRGALVSVSVVRSSGDSALDRAALTAVQRARIPAAPNGVAPGNQTFNLPMSFRP